MASRSKYETRWNTSKEGGLWKRLHCYEWWAYPADRCGDTYLATFKSEKRAIQYANTYFGDWRTK